MAIKARDLQEVTLIPIISIKTSVPSLQTSVPSFQTSVPALQTKIPSPQQLPSSSNAQSISPTISSNPSSPGSVSSLPPVPPLLLLPSPYLFPFFPIHQLNSLPKTPIPCLLVPKPNILPV
ncbi:hypothetical protein U1Q18_043824 [Sarracenia purpurea var. burkii]